MQRGHNVPPTQSLPERHANPVSKQHTLKSATDTIYVYMTNDCKDYPVVSTKSVTQCNATVMHCTVRHHKIEQNSDRKNSANALRHASFTSLVTSYTIIDHGNNDWLFIADAYGPCRRNRIGSYFLTKCLRHMRQACVTVH